MTPVHQLLTDLARWSPGFMDDSRARRYWIDRAQSLLADGPSLAAMLGSPSEWAAAQEIAAAAQVAAELEGNVQAQRVFLTAIKVLAPLTSSQREWAVARLATIGG